MGFSFISMRITTTASISKEARQARLGRQAFGLCGFPCHVPIPAVSAACSVCSLRDGETHEPPRNAAAINNNNNIHHHHFATLPLDSLIIRSSTNYRQSSHFATSSSSFCPKFHNQATPDRQEPGHTDNGTRTQAHRASNGTGTDGVTHTTHHPGSQPSNSDSTGRRQAHPRRGSLEKANHHFATPCT